jgi:hypothetical protein
MKGASGGASGLDAPSQRKLAVSQRPTDVAVVPLAPLERGGEKIFVR